ncbi:hypothetical protein D3C77_560390 [compost metagenome]
MANYPDELKRATIELNADGTESVAGLVHNAFHCFYVRDGVLYMDSVNQAPGLRSYRVTGHFAPLVLSRGVVRDLEAVVVELLAALKRSTAFNLLAFAVRNAANRGGLELDLINGKGWRADV